MITNKIRYLIKIENEQKSSLYIVYPKDSIEKLKTKIQDKTGIKIKFQNLYFKNILLDNNKNLQDYNISPSSTLRLEIKPQEKIIIFIKSALGQKITLETKKNIKIGKLKKIISFKEKIPEYLILLKFNNKVLENGKTLEDYSIGNYSKLVLSLFGNKYEIIKVYVYFYSRKICINTINNLYNVKTIKNKICELIEIPSTDLKLYYKDKILSNDNEILDIDYDSIIKAYSNTISVNIKDSSGIIKKYRVRLNDSIEELKLKIEKEEDICNSSIILKFEDKELEDSSLIYDCYIKNNSCILFTDVGNRIIYFFIKHNGISHIFKSKLSEKIKTIKNEIKEKAKMNFMGDVDLILNYGGIFLNDNMSLFDYGVQNGSTIDIYN